MNPDDVDSFLLAKYTGTIAVDAWGERSIFYNPGLVLPCGVYFATVKEKDGDNDKASNLDREGVYRLNIGTPKDVFVEQFGATPLRPAKGCSIQGDWDFTVLDQLTPHPVYGWMGWVSINNSSEEVFNGLSVFLDAAYEKSVVSFQKR